MKLITLLLACFLSGCILAEPKPIQTGADSYVATATACGFYGCVPKVMRDAAKSCAERHLNLVVGSLQSAMMPISTATLSYLCVSADDSRYQTSILRPDNGIHTEQIQ